MLKIFVQLVRILTGRETGNHGADQAMRPSPTLKPEGAPSEVP